ncbi:MAG: PIN domain nuclease [Actinomycetota bacterium]|nr:PIN domain nuclease [Actinomycetota bacterium]
MATERPHLLDVNVLVALSWPQHVHHHRAHSWFADRRSPTWATTPITEAGFVRISSNTAVIAAAVSVADAVQAIGALRALPGHTFVPDDSSLADPLIDLTRLVTPRQVTDFHLVNLAARSGALLSTLDTAILSYLIEADRRFVEVLPA